METNDKPTRSHRPVPVSAIGGGGAAAFRMVIGGLRRKGSGRNDDRLPVRSIHCEGATGCDRVM